MLEVIILVVTFVATLCLRVKLILLKNGTLIFNDLL